MADWKTYAKAARNTARKQAPGAKDAARRASGRASAYVRAAERAIDEGRRDETRRSPSRDDEAGPEERPHPARADGAGTAQDPRPPRTTTAPRPRKDREQLTKDAAAYYEVASRRVAAAGIVPRIMRALRDALLIGLSLVVIWAVLAAAGIPIPFTTVLIVVGLIVLVSFASGLYAQWRRSRAALDADATTRERFGERPTGSGTSAADGARGPVVRWNGPCPCPDPLPTAASAGPVRGGHDRVFLPRRTVAVPAGPPPHLPRHRSRRLASTRRAAGDVVDGGADRGGADPSVGPAVPLADGAHGHPGADHHLGHGVGAAFRRGAAEDPPRRGVPPPAGAADPAAQRGRAGDDPGDAAVVAVGGGAGRTDGLRGSGLVRRGAGRAGAGGAGAALRVHGEGLHRCGVPAPPRRDARCADGVQPR